jgi:hypothetical protein
LFGGRCLPVKIIDLNEGIKTPKGLLDSGPCRRIVKIIDLNDVDPLSNLV